MADDVPVTTPTSTESGCSNETEGGLGCASFLVAAISGISCFALLLSRHIVCLALQLG